MTQRPFRVLLIGATGVFGRLLAAALVREPGVVLVMAGRTLSSLQRMGQTLDVETAVLDRDTVTDDDLRALGVHVVIDAAGPFQQSRTAVIEAAISAGCHYMDLADGRDFIAGVGRFDNAGRASGVVVLSGASSTPALSHAVVDHLTMGWRSIATIRAVISPGSAVRGLALMRGVLSYLGRPVRVFREGGWAAEPGWGATRTMDIAGMRTGPASLCETPDTDLFVDRYHPSVAAEFLSSLELPPLHRGLSALGLLVRWGVLRRPERFARPLRLVVGLIAPFGANRGGMVVETAGRDGQGTPVFARWLLRAPPGNGPNVPTFAALALVRRLRNGGAIEAGARPCVGVLNLTDFMPDFERLDMESETRVAALPELLFARVLGAAFDALPEVNRRVHTPDPALVLTGEADVTGAATVLGRAMARLFGLPPEATAAPLRVVIEATPDGRELWSRVYPTRVMRSIMCNPDSASRTVEEHFGPFRFRLRIDAADNGLALVPVGGRLWRVPLPGFLMPWISATEAVDGERHLFDVSIGLPLIGRLVRYRGWLH
jgi:hypothetical protein